MSRTNKDAPYFVKENRVANRIAVHVACPHSVAGGRWTTRATVIEHEPEWHTDVEYDRDFMLDDVPHWVSREKLAERYIKRGLSRARALLLVETDNIQNPTREIDVFGPWTEVIWNRVWEVRECDLEVPSGHRPRSRRWVRCHWDSNLSGEEFRKLYPRYHPPRDDRRLMYYGPERSSVRDELRAIRDEWNTHGDSWTEAGIRQTRRGTWGGGWWD